MPNTNQIFALRPTKTADKLELDKVWAQKSSGLAAGYTCAIPVQVGKQSVLFAYNKTAQRTDLYLLTDANPWVKLQSKKVNLDGGPWDSLSTFVLGNEPYVMTYRADDGTFGFFHVGQDLSVSPPYKMVFPRNTPTKGFTAVAPVTSLGQQYVLGYNFDDGTVAAFSISVIPASADGTPPLLGLNVWYHHWAKGWTHFAFFQLGGANFFFKINTAKLNVNIDHLQDNPAFGTVEVGSQLQAQMPDALSVSLAAHVPWSNGEPYLLTYIASSGDTKVFRVHADCLGWTRVAESSTGAGTSMIVPYRIGNTTYILFYGGGK